MAANSSGVVMHFYRVTYVDSPSAGELANHSEQVQKAYLYFLQKMGCHAQKVLARVLGDKTGIPTRSLLTKLKMSQEFPIEVPLDEELNPLPNGWVKKFEDSHMKDYHESVRVSLLGCLRKTSKAYRNNPLDWHEQNAFEREVALEIKARIVPSTEKNAVVEVQPSEIISLGSIIGKPIEDMELADVAMVVEKCPIKPVNDWEEIKNNPTYLRAMRHYFPHVTNADICKYLLRGTISSSALGTTMKTYDIEPVTKGRKTLYVLEVAAFVAWSGGDVDTYLKWQEDKQTMRESYKTCAAAKRTMISGEERTMKTKPDEKKVQSKPETSTTVTPKSENKVTEPAPKKEAVLDDKATKPVRETTTEPAPKHTEYTMNVVLTSENAERLYGFFAELLIFAKDDSRVKVSLNPYVYKSTS